jgi:hypothetical protein
MYTHGNNHPMRTMKTISVIAVLLILAANVLSLLPALSVYQPYLLYTALAFGIIALVALLASPSRTRGGGGAATTAARPTQASPPANQAEAEVVSFLAMLQAKGRLVDFLMDDISTYDDAQLGAAARVVHAGCKAVLQEHFHISPVREEREGTTVQVPVGYAADEYRLLGRIAGKAPFSGVLIHHGWKADSVKLPRILRDSTHRLPTIAPAEVELK